MTQIKNTLNADKLSTAGAPDTRNKVVLVTVHGTGAGDVTATGDRWWQLGSNFLKELGKRLDLDPARVEIYPFQWDLGPNSEAERRKAGAALYEQLSSYEEAGTEYYVVSHSHGGSVLYATLLQSVAKDKPLEKLKTWCTVGTPFLDYRPNKFLYQRLNGFGLTFFATGFFSVLLGFCALIRWLFWEGDFAIFNLWYALFFYAGLCFGGLYLFERFRKSWVSDEKKQQTAKLYADRWFGLWHLEDEAISALTNIKRVTAEIIQPNFLQPVVSLAQLVVVSWFGIFFAWDILFNNALILVDGMLSYAESTEGKTEEEIAALYDVSNMVGGILGYVFVLFIVVLIITYLLKFLAWFVGKLTSRRLNEMFWSSIRKRVWGDDIQKEDVRAINAHPPEIKDLWGSLPEPVAGELRGHSEKHAIMTLHKVREILGMSRDSNSTPDLRNQLEESLKWQELIHTSYFDVPAFIDLLAFGLHRAGLAEFKKDFVMTPERETLFAWCNRNARP